MRTATIHVYGELDGSPIHAGVMRCGAQRGRERCGFEYSADWLADARRYPLDPELPLFAGVQYPGQRKCLFNAFSDAAPDRWGRYLVVKAEKHRAALEQRAPRSLLDIDFLLGVSDATRMGALRFTVEGPEGAESQFLASRSPDIPPLVALRRLQGVARRIEAGEETGRDLALLLAPGTSLGGARPKAVVRSPEGDLMVAKFEREQDAWPVIRWEALMLGIAAEAGIEVPASQLEEVDGRAVLLMKRFDRRGTERIPFASALTLVGGVDGGDSSYLDLAGALIQDGAAPQSDLEQLWRRMAFNVMTSNTDDHLRNHGFLRAGPGGWRLSPAFDMNPVPAEAGPRVMSLALDESGDRTGSLSLVREAANYFGLSRQRAEAVLQEVAAGVSRWRALAPRVGLSEADCRHMESAFSEAAAALKPVTLPGPGRGPGRGL